MSLENGDNDIKSQSKNRPNNILNSPYIIAQNIWRIISNKQTRSSDPKKINPVSYEVEWGYFVDIDRLYNNRERQRSYSSTTVVPFLKPIKEIDHSIYKNTKQRHYGFLYSLCQLIQEHRCQFIQRVFIVFSITIITTISTYTLYKIY